MQKSPTPTPFPQQNHNPLTISPLPHQRYQKPLEGRTKTERRQGESRAKGERRISVIALNIRHFTSTPPLCIIRNKIPKTLHFPQSPSPPPLISSFPNLLILKFPNLLISLTPIRASDLLGKCDLFCLLATNY